MSKRILTTIGCLSLVALTQPQMLKNILSEIARDWIEPAWPIVAGIIILIGVGNNLDKFFGENRDIKSGVSNILVYAVVILQ